MNLSKYFSFLLFQVRYISEVVVCIDSASNLIFQLEEIRSQGLRGLIKNQVSVNRVCVF